MTGYHIAIEYYELEEVEVDSDDEVVINSTIAPFAKKKNTHAKGEVIMKIYFVKTNAYNDVCFDYPEEQKCYMLNPKNGYVDSNKDLDLYSDNIIDKLEAYYKSLISDDILDPNGEYYDYSDEGRDNFFANMELHEIITEK